MDKSDTFDHENKPHLRPPDSAICSERNADDETTNVIFDVDRCVKCCKMDWINERTQDDDVDHD